MLAQGPSRPFRMRPGLFRPRRGRLIGAAQDVARTIYDALRRPPRQSRHRPWDCARSGIARLAPALRLPPRGVLPAVGWTGLRLGPRLFCPLAVVGAELSSLGYARHGCFRCGWSRLSFATLTRAAEDLGGGGPVGAPGAGHRRHDPSAELDGAWRCDLGCRRYHLSVRIATAAAPTRFSTRNFA